MHMKLSVTPIKWKRWVLSWYIKVWERTMSSSSSDRSNIVKGKNLSDFDKRTDWIKAFRKMAVSIYLLTVCSN